MKKIISPGNKTRSFIALLFCWIAVLLSNSIAAQSTCATPIAIVNKSGVGDLTPLGNVWFSLTGDALIDNISIHPFVPMTPPYNLPILDTIELYSGSCGTLISVAVVTNTTGQMRAVIPNLTLVTGTTYFLRVHTSCTSCSDKIQVVTTYLGPSYCDADCNLNCNGSLENVQQGIPVAYPSQAALTSCWDVVYEPSGGTWTNIPSLYYNGTPDLYSTNCSTTYNNFCVPNNEMGNAASFSGTGYAGVFGFEQYANQQPKEYREYIQQEMCHKMIQGHKYRVSFRAQLSDSSAWATRLGVVLMDTLLIQGANANNVPGVFDSIPPAYVTPSVVTNMTAWQLYSFVYTATSDHTQIAIGNFKNDSAQYRTQLNNHIHREVISPIDIRYYYMAYYYIDSVNVVPLDEIVMNTDTIYNCLGDRDTLNASLVSATPHAVYSWTSIPVDASLLNWQSNWNIAHPNLPDTQVVVHPNVNTTYYVTVTDTFYNCTFRDTFFIKVANTTLDSLKGDVQKCVAMPRYILYHHPANSNVVCNWYTTTGDLVIGNGNDTVRVNWLGSIGLNSWLYVYATDTLAGCTWKDSIYVQSCCVSDTGRIFYNDTASRVFGTNPGIIYFRHFNVNGTLLIDQDMMFIGCNFNMGLNASIIISGGNTVEFQADSIKAGCCQMWDGVIGQSVNDSIIIDKFSYLGDAIRGIVSNNGAVYRVFNNVTFNRNLVSITVNPYAGTHGGTVQEATFTSVTANYCPTSSGKLLAPYAGQWPQYGISAKSVNAITFGNPALAIYVNTFTNLRNGIRTKFTNCNIYNNKFIAVNKATNGKGVWCVGRYPTVTPLNLTQYNVTVGGTSQYQRNSFQDCPFGVFTDTAMSTTVINNRFSQTGYTTSPISLRGEAIHVNNCTGLVRTVTISGDTIANHKIGVSLNQNNRCVTSVTKNLITRTVNGATTCTAIYQVCNGNNAGATTIATNVIKNVQYGVRVANVKLLMINQNLIYLRPTPTSYLGPVRGVFAANSTLLFVIQNQIYKENPTATIPSNWVGGIYIANCASSVVDCNSINNIGYGILFEGSGSTNSTVLNNEMNSTATGIWLKNGAIIGQQGNSVAPADNKWQGAVTNRLYTSGTVPNITLGNFSPFFYRSGNTAYLPAPSIAAVNSNPIPTFSAPSNSPTQLICSYAWPHVLSSAQNVQIALGQINFGANQVAGEWLTRESLYRLMLEDSTVALGDSILTNFKDSADQANIGKLSAAMDVHSNGGLNSQSEITAAYNAAAGITPNDNVEANYKAVETILLGHELNGGEFTVQELNELRDIAQLCPFTDGNAVYLARGLLAPIDSIEYENSCEMNEGNARMAAPATDVDSVFTFNLFPNPSSGSITLDYQLSGNETGKLEIFSIAGSLITSIQLEAGQRVRTVLLPELGAGTYLYKVSVNGEMKLADRLVIIK
ncbi:MAG: T9SS type A sorting domain-containing protein [Bacteroidia bacterium]